ncbi:MAG: NAD(P)-dependent oxidoreductase [Synergistaceae bacterium]|nr:NAD(P)-dependent oxidoreductase [Synergistaceae bacterium]
MSDRFTNNKPVGFIGLGAMGSSIVRNLISKGFSLIVNDISRDAMDRLSGDRVEKASAPSEIGDRAEICLIMVTTYSQCRSVLFDESGLLAGKRCKVVVLLSTIAPDEAESLQKDCFDRGVQILDCPVSGGTKGAAEGTLTLMASGDKEVFSFCLPLLKSFSERQFFIGEKAGMGQGMKAVNQLLFGVQMVAMAEAVVLGKKHGISPDLIFDVVSSSSGSSNVFLSRMPSVIRRDFSTRSTLDIQLKDMNICLRAGEQKKSPLFLASAAKELYKLAGERFDSKEDSSAVIKLYELLAGCD